MKKDYKILVTGATGFIGKHLVRKLVKQEKRVRCLVRKTSDASALRDIGVELWYGDVIDKKSLKGISKGIKTVFHLAAIGDINMLSKDSIEDYRRVNVKGTKNLLEEFKDKRITRFIHFSSVAAMGSQIGQEKIDEKEGCLPKTPYEITKYESELVAMRYYREHRVPVVIIRPTMVYGRGDKKEMSKIKASINLRLVPILGTGENLIHMVHVNDVVDAAMLASKKGKKGQTYIITNDYYTWNELVDILAEKSGISVRKVHIPLVISRPIVKLVESVGELSGITPPFTTERLEGLRHHRIFDNSKAKKELGFRPKVRFDSN